MIRILILYPPFLDNVGYWRLFRPLEVMRSLYPGVFSMTYKNKELTFGDIMAHDIIITRRPSNDGGNIMVELLQVAISFGKPVIFDEDDLVIDCPDTHELAGVYQKPEVRKLYVDAMKSTSSFWFSTPAFLETIYPAGEVIPNAVLPSDIRDEPAPDLGMIGWQGKSIQAHDLILGGWDWYEENKTHPLVKQWVFLGWKPPLRHADNTTMIPYIPKVDVYIGSFKINGINAMWKPLIEHPFNDHKSNINFLTAVIGGGYCISNYAGKPGWEYASKEILPYDQACELWREAKTHVLTHYNLFDTARMRAESILSLLPQFRDIMFEKEVRNGAQN